MDTFRSLLVSNVEGLESTITICEIPEEHKVIIERYVNTFTVITEVNQLYQVFWLNVNIMSSNCILNSDDTVLISKNGLEADPILVNALFNNIISSGRVLVDKIKTILESDFSENRYTAFQEEYLSRIYNEIFSYRFFYELRNFCQHGYLVVSHKEGKYCFDLYQLLGAEHLGIKKSQSKEWKNAIKTIAEKYNSEPNICFTHNVDSYVKSILEVYYHFWEFIKKDIELCDNAFREVINANPQYVYNESPLDGFIIYKIENGNAHMIRPEENLVEFYSVNKSIAKEKNDSYEKEFHK